MRYSAQSLLQLSPVTGTTSESLTVSSSSVGLTTPLSDLCTHILITVGANPIRARFDGGNPGSAIGGHYFVAGQMLVITKAMSVNAKFIRVSSDSEVYATQLSP